MGAERMRWSALVRPGVPEILYRYLLFNSHLYYDGTCSVLSFFAEVVDHERWVLCRDQRERHKITQ